MRALEDSWKASKIRSAIISLLFKSKFPVGSSQKYATSQANALAWQHVVVLLLIDFEDKQSVLHTYFFQDN